MEKGKRKNKLLETLGNENIHEPKVLPCWLEEGKLQTAVNQEKKKETEIWHHRRWQEAKETANNENMASKLQAQFSQKQNFSQ